MNLLLQTIQKNKKKVILIKSFFLFLFIISLGITVNSAARKSYHKWLESQLYAPAPEGMAFVPSGEFLMGSNDPNVEADERPLRTMFAKAFYIDKYEITNANYKKTNPDHYYLKGDDDLPVTGIFRPQAKTYCQQFGKRLPTNLEWEKAARGIDGRRYPWGNELRPGLANIRIQNSDSVKLMPVGSYPEGISPFGCYDMSGNVWEWVSGDISSGSLIDFDSDDMVRGIVRGGAFRYSPFQARTSYQGFEDPALTCNDIGFRCAMDAKVIK